MKISKLVLNLSLIVMTGAASSHVSAAALSKSSSKGQGTDTTMQDCGNESQVGRFTVTTVKPLSNRPAAASTSGSQDGQH